MKRVKSIDTLRGISICWMIIGHTSGWWIQDQDFWIAPLLMSIFDFLGSLAFMFVSGASTVMYYRKRFETAKQNRGYNAQMAKNEYFFRSLFLLFIALVYNISIAIAVADAKDVWKWFVLFAIAISLFIAWPLLHMPKWFRLMICIISWTLYLILIINLYPHAKEPNLYGVMFHTFFNSLDLDPILGFFPFFLLGTIFGDIIYEISNIDDMNMRRRALKKKFLIPSFIICLVLIIAGILFELNLDIYYGHSIKEPYPDFLIRGSFPWMMYSLGVFLLLFTILITVEEYELFKTEKSYKFFYYFSYYSLTVYLAHNVLYILFYNQLNLFIIGPAIIITIILIYLLLRIIYIKFGAKLSIKAQLGVLAVVITKKLEKRRNNIKRS